VIEGARGIVLHSTSYRTRRTACVPTLEGNSSYRPSSVAGEGELAFIIPGQFEQESACQVFNSRQFDFERGDTVEVRITVSSPPHIRPQLKSLGEAK
jgi:hypothetical protein